MHLNKSYAIILVLIAGVCWAFGITAPLNANPQSKAPVQKKQAQEEKDKKPEIKPYDEVITEGAKSDDGLFTSRSRKKSSAKP
jgi:hypothetical protein